MKKLFSRIRFLPLTIFAATLMLTVKIGDIWDGFGGLLNGTIQVADALAQTGGQGATPPAAAQPAQKGAKGPAKDAAQKGGAQKGAPQKDAAKKDTAKKDAAKPAEAGKPGDAAKMAATETMPAAKDQAAAPTSKLITDDPTLLTQNEIDLLQQLAERRRVLESREQEVLVRTSLLSAAESRIDKRIEELKLLRETINGLIKTFDEQQDKKLQSLVKIYESMKPKEAAQIFEELEMDTLLEVAERMKERKLAPIMAKMNPDKARDMTVELAKLRQLPRASGQAGG